MELASALATMQTYGILLILAYMAIRLLFVGLQRII